MRVGCRWLSMVKNDMELLLDDVIGLSSRGLFE